MQPSTGKKVAIIGAGLAGLTVAYHLSSLGHACTVIEKHSRPGGPLNELGENILPADILDYEIDQIRKCGVTFRLDKKVTSLQELSGAFDATVIACGSQSIQWIEQQGIRCTERGVEVQKGTFATSVGGVFAIGGAIVPGKSASRTVGWPIRTGIREAVKRIRHTIKPDILFVSNAFLLGIASSIKLKSNIPLICMLQDEHFWVDSGDPSYQHVLWDAISEKFDYVDMALTHSNWFKEKFSNDVRKSNGKITVIPFGVDPSEYSTVLSKDNDTFTIGSLGRICNSLGIEIFVAYG